MNRAETYVPVGKFLAAAKVFLRDFAVYVGRKGVKAVMFVALGGLAEGLGLLLLVPLLGVVFGTSKADGHLQHVANALFALVGAQSAVGRLVWLLALFAFLMVVRAIVISIRNVMLAELQIGFVETQRARVTERLAAARWDQVARLHHARVTHLMSGDIQRVGNAAHFLLQGITAVAMLTVQCLLAFLLAPFLALIAFSFLIAGMLALAPVVRRARELGNYVTNANLTLLNETAQFLGGLKLAVSQNLQAGFVAEFRATLSALTARQIAYVRQNTNSQLALTTLLALAAAVLVLIGFGIFHTLPALLTTLLVVIGRMSAPANQLQQGAQQIAHALPAYEEIKALEAELACTASNVDLLPTASLPDGRIVFDHVSFAHGEDDESGGVRDLSLEIAPQEVLGIAGPSGAGKTTFTDLLAGLYPPQSGAIRIGGVPLDARLLPLWRASLAYVSQDPFLFHDTVRCNLSWAAPEVREEEMWTALALVGADGLVRRMEPGLDAVVGERGTLVSGGERQRLALVRAILRKPKLLVLDEATSAIDIAGERAILGNLLALDPKPTIVMIAHRRESLARCTRVITLDGGRLRLQPKTG